MVLQKKHLQLQPSNICSSNSFELIHQIPNHILETYNSNVQWLSGNEERSSPLEMPLHMPWVNSKWFEKTDSSFALSQINNDWYLPSALLPFLI